MDYWIRGLMDQVHQAAALPLVRKPGSMPWVASTLFFDMGLEGLFDCGLRIADGFPEPAADGFRLWSVRYRAKQAFPSSLRFRLRRATAFARGYGATGRRDKSARRGGGYGVRLKAKG
jgi:hypothetical protein